MTRQRSNLLVTECDGKCGHKYLALVGATMHPVEDRHDQVVGSRRTDGAIVNQGRVVAVPDTLAAVAMTACTVAEIKLCSKSRLSS